MALPLLTCIDRDGDGYGRGWMPWTDADDLDAVTTTGAQALAKYGTPNAFSRTGILTDAHLVHRHDRKRFDLYLRGAHLWASARLA